MENALTVIEQREVAFYDDEVTAVRSDDGQIYASIRHMCDALGVDDNAQQQRMRRHAILSEGRRACKLHAPGTRSVQTAYVLRVDLVPLWLSGIRLSAVSDEIRPKLERFQREAAKVLWEAFQEGRLTVEPTFDELLAADSPAAQAYKMASAIMQMARQQLLLENRVESRFKEYDERLEAIEATLGDPGRMITPDQASQISQGVKAVALVLSRQSRRNEYGGVYGELYRKYGITSYKQLPAHKFDEALRWLADWLQSLTDTNTPF